MKLKVFNHEITLEIRPIKMARLCIRIVPNNHPTDSKKNALRTQVGDVVEICEDGHKWSETELNCGQYKFVDVPGVSAEELTYLKDSIFDKDGKIIARRKVRLDKTALLSNKWKSAKTMTKANIISLTKIT